MVFENSFPGILCIEGSLGIEEILLCVLIAVKVEFAVKLQSLFCARDTG